jgi:hypothetical protein
MEDYVWHLAVAAVLVVVIWAIFLQIDKLKRKFDYLDNRINECAKKWEFEWADKKLREHNEKLEALEVHLGIRFVETPKRLVVKNILENQK